MGINKNFVVKNGIEVNDNLIYGDPDTSKVGIGTRTPTTTLDVAGIIQATTVQVLNNLIFNGSLEINGNSGDFGQYLISTGTGVAWANVPGIRNIYTFIAEVDQTTFNVVYDIGSNVDVYNNGTRLSNNDYVANDGSSVILNVPCFGEETIEVVAYSVFGSSAPGLTIQNNSSGIGTALSVNAINFVGFNSIGLNQSGLGVTVYNSTTDVSYSGIVTALGGFISVGNTSPVKISVSGNRLIFTVTGIGSTSFTLA